MYRSADETPDFDQSSTVQHDLQAAGYRTGIFGKYLNGWDLAEDPPYFDDWAIFSKSFVAGYQGGVWNVNGEKRSIDSYSTTFIRGQALRFVQEASEDDRPWALFITTNAPHYPITPDEKYRDAPVPPPEERSASFMERDLSDKPGFVRQFTVSRREVEETRVAQLRTLMSVDDLVSDLYGRLDELGEEGNTLSFFLSDNGFILGDHSIVGKMVPYEMSIRIPLMMRWPEELEPGTVDGRWATTVDLVPTLLDATGISRSKYVDGKSLIDQGWNRDRVMSEFWRNHGRPSWGSLLTERFQYTEYFKGGKVYFREYYDLQDDPARERNLLGDSDPSNDPDLDAARRQLASDLRCKANGCP
jgi:arylsulfatase A-like enzyme